MLYRVARKTSSFRARRMSIPKNVICAYISTFKYRNESFLNFIIDIVRRFS